MRMLPANIPPLPKNEQTPTNLISRIFEKILPINLPQILPINIYGTNRPEGIAAPKLIAQSIKNIIA